MTVKEYYYLVMKTLYININGERIDSTENVVVVGKAEDAIINRFYFELGKEILKGVVAPGIGSIKKKDIILDYKIHDEIAFNTMMEQWEAFKCQLLGDNPVGEFTVKLSSEYISWLNDSSIPVYVEAAKSLHRRSGVVSIGIDKVYTNISNLIINNIDNGDFASVVVNDNLVTDDSALVMAIQKKFPNVTFKPFEEWEVEAETMQSQIAEDAKEEKSTDIVVGHRMVDLGLSVCWADCNVGANSPEEYGGYYAWGETEEKAKYDWDTYKFGNVVKYKMKIDQRTCRCIKDASKTQLDDEDDVAQVKWGNNWRMPTYPEIKELVNECSWEWITVNDVTGYKVTGPNGNSVFLPAAGFYTSSKGNDCSQVHLCSEMGYYWCSSLLEEVEGTGPLAYYANLGVPLCLGFRESYGSWYTIDVKCQGFTIRPVIDKK